MPSTSFVKELKAQYKNGMFPAHIQEEYIKLDGILDCNYVSQLININLSESQFRCQVNDAIGTVRFKKETHENGVSRDMFFKYYKFGLYPNTRGWIGHFTRIHGLLLTREKLYEYITTRSST